VSGGLYEFEPQNALGKRLDVSGAGTGNGTQVQIWTDSNVPQQRWYLNGLGNNIFELRCGHQTFRCLDVSGAGTTDGTKVHIWQPGGSSNQRWKFLSLPSPWQSGDIGGPGYAGGDSYLSGVFTVSGGGADIFGTSDQFRYVYQTASGDCEIKAKVTSQQNTDAWAKAGVMIRESTAANSKNMMMEITPGNGFSMNYRTTAGGSSTSVAGGTLNTAPNNWVRLVRTGNTLKAYKSADGTSWTQVGSNVTLTMNSSVTIGLAVTSHNNGFQSQATFSNVTATP
jgi:regulation of enolase protein 1 (concanavalin A-like superfamily)